MTIVMHYNYNNSLWTWNSNPAFIFYTSLTSVVQMPYYLGFLFFCWNFTLLNNNFVLKMNQTKQSEEN